MNRLIHLVTMSLVVVLLTSCGGAQAPQSTNTEVPTPTTTPTFPPTLTPTSTPTSTPEPPAYITLENVEQITELKATEVKVLGGLLFSPDGQFLLTGTRCCVSFYDIETLQPTREIGPSGLREHYPSIALSKDGKLVALGGSDGKISI